MYQHQYIERNSGQVITEKPIGDYCISLLYNTMREKAPVLFRALTSGRMSELLSYLHYDMVGRNRVDGSKIFRRINADPQECVEPVGYYTSYRKIFERQIRYWHTRPMTHKTKTVVSPADARVLIGSLAESSSLFIKNKFFDLQELLGADSPHLSRFQGGDFAVFRLTPDKYHYSHVPVKGRVVAIYELDGRYHSCNPSAFVTMASLYSKNKRVVTILDTDVEGGTQVGLVGMVEVVALMIGEVVQRYSTVEYECPQDIEAGMMLERGVPKSLYRPGSSTDVLIFEPGKIEFAEDLVRNSQRNDVSSRFSIGFSRPLVETDVLVRSSIARPCK